jgi:tetratricopeptide (TPR) repeat protein
MSRRSQLTPRPMMPLGAIHRRWILRLTMALAALLLLSCSPAAREARLLKRGKSYLEKKDYARAVLEFRSAQQAMPQDVEPYYQEGLAYVGLGNYQAAFKAFNRGYPDRSETPGRAGEVD